MELTKNETRTLVLAVGTAIEHEKAALEGLRNQAREWGVSRAVSDRESHLADLERIRQRLIARPREGRDPKLAAESH
jgi:hypothetical protein